MGLKRRTNGLECLFEGMHRISLRFCNHRPTFCFLAPSQPNIPFAGGR